MGVNKMENKKISKASKVLGIVSICVGWLIPLIGIVCGIVGLCVKKEKYNRDIALNVVGLCVSLLFWLIGFLMMVGFMWGG